MVQLKNVIQTANISLLVGLKGTSWILGLLLTWKEGFPNVTYLGFLALGSGTKDYTTFPA